MELLIELFGRCERTNILLYLHDFALSYGHLVGLCKVTRYWQEMSEMLTVKGVYNFTLHPQFDHHQSQCHPFTIIHYRKGNGPKVRGSL